MQKTNVHFSSKTSEWETPQDFFDTLNKEFSLNVDVCATSLNAKLSEYFTREQDSLSQSWKGKRCWMNPPYGREIGKWVAKAATGGRDCGGAPTLTNRYSLVARLHSGQGRGQVHQRTAQIRRSQKQRAVSLVRCNF